MNEYGVLSFLHEILYESSEEILDRAEKVGQQPNEVLAVIRVLKQTRVTLNDKYKNRENNQKRQKERTVKEMKALADKTSWSTSARRLWSNLKTSITQPKKNITNKAVIDAFVQSGLNIQARTEDGQKKILSIIKVSLDSVEDLKRTEMLKNVSALLELDQTKGWMEVIKSEKHYKYL